jgi:DNA-directed RNA polymerase subunit omega
MARITVEDCLEIVGDDNRFNLIHLAVQRIKQHRQGEPFLVEGKNKEIVMTLREIASGKVTMENVDDLPGMSGKTEKVTKLSAETVSTVA